jgi:acetyl-CoA C-acetyltransferase
VEGAVTDPRAPCIIGVAQRTIHPEQGDAPEPLDLWEEMARAAAADCGKASALDAIDDLRVVYSLSWQYDDPPGRLAERLGLPEGGRHYSGLSGTSPQKFLDEAAREILSGRGDLTLVVGGEALATKRRLKKAGRKPEWSFAPEQKPRMPFDDPFHPAEIAHEVFQAYLTFAVFDVARREHLGLSPQKYRRQLGALMAPLSEVAAKNPRAWLRRAYSPQELIEVTPENRMVAYPYTKRLVSVLDIDMAAGVLLASHEKADALGVAPERRVYLRGFCHGRDPVYVAEREELWRSPAMQEASRTALDSAGLGIDDVAYFDLYSCFGSSIQFARDALGLAADDPRPLTVTGGLPFHGGPGNDYLTHSVASLVEILREDPGSVGMVSGVGMHMQNHVFALYSTRPGILTLPDEVAVQARLDAAPKREIRQPATGPATVAAYSVVHGRSGPAWGLAVCELPDGARCYARIHDADLVRSLEESEWVGRSVVLRDGGRGVNRIEP